MGYEFGQQCGGWTRFWIAEVTEHKETKILTVCCTWSMAALVLLCLIGQAAAQVSTAYVIGIVEDTSRARVANASIKLINMQTGTTNWSITNAAGAFALAGVLPGIYALQIERAGFSTVQLRGLQLSVGDTKSVLIRMKIGTVSESVTVDASGITINATDASVSTIVDRRFVRNIPLNGRSFQDLISMTPGITTQSTQVQGQSPGTQGEFGVNGQTPQANYYVVDGVSANINPGAPARHPQVPSTGTIAGSTALGTTQSLVAVDALQEFRVLSSTYPAQYGRTTGGQFSFLTRAGTNQLHWSAYEYFRSSVLDATDWFANHINRNAVRPSHQNDFGGTIGGPIIVPHLYDGHDKTFFLASYEGLRLLSPAAELLQYVPSFAVREAAPAAIQPLLNAFPEPSGPELNDLLGNPSGLATYVFETDSLPSHINATSARIDHAFSPHMSAFFRFGDTPSYSDSRQLTSLATSKVNILTVTLGASGQFSATKSDEFRFGYGTSESSLDSRLKGYLSSGPVDLVTAVGLPDSSGAAVAPYISVPGVGTTEVSTEFASSRLHQWNITNTLAIQASNHLLKFGIDDRHIVSTIAPSPIFIQPSFYNRTSITANSASTILITKSESASPVINEFSAFAQDEWRVFPSLSLSLGLRWEVDPAPTEQHGSAPYTLLGTVDSPKTLTLAPMGTSLWQTSWSNLAPRVGAAWIVDPESARELVVRAGAGVFFGTGSAAAADAYSELGFTASIAPVNLSVPIDPSLLDFSIAPSAPYLKAAVFAFPRHFQLPYSIHWNVSVDKALGKYQALTLTYVGQEGERLQQEQRRNVAGANPDFGDVYFFPSGVTSNYQGFQLKFQRLISHGVQALAAYTWAHSLDYGSTDPSYPLTRGNSDLDIRHNLQAALSWDIAAQGNGLLRKFTGGWGTDARLMARSGFPVTPLGNQFLDQSTGDRYYSGVDWLPGRQLYRRNGQYPGGRILNGGADVANPAFILPLASAPGDAPRNLARGFGDVELNLAGRRDIHLSERLSLQGRVEAFNVFNHPNFGYIDPILTDAQFGQATRMLNQSLGSVNAFYQQGGPRSIQFTLRLTF